MTETRANSRPAEPSEIEPPANPSSITATEPAPKRRRKRTPKPAAVPPFCADAIEHERNMRALGQMPIPPHVERVGEPVPPCAPTLGQQIGGWIDSLGPGGGATLPDSLKYAIGTMAGAALTALLARNRKE